MAVWYLHLAILLVDITAEATRCLECTDLPHPQFCSTVTKCKDTSECHVTQFISSGGLILYDTGCKDRMVCKASKRGLHENIMSYLVQRSSSTVQRSSSTDIVTCVSCTDGDYSNIEGCGTTATRQPVRGPICFSCSALRDPASCRDVTTCQVGELCGIYRHESFPNVWVAGCVTGQQCKQSVFTTVFHGNTSNSPCSSCCNDDFCNAGCSPSTSVPTSLSSTIHPSTGNPISLSSTIHPSTGNPISLSSTIHPSTGNPISLSSTIHPSTGNPISLSSTIHPSTGNLISLSSTIPSSAGIPTSPTGVPISQSSTIPSATGDPISLSSTFPSSSGDPISLSSKVPSATSAVHSFPSTTPKPITTSPQSTSLPTSTSQPPTTSTASTAVPTTSRITTKEPIHTSSSIGTTVAPTMPSTTIIQSTDRPPLVTDKACPFKPVDIVFVLDGSGSESTADFNQQLQFVHNITNQFEIGPNHTRISLLTFSTKVHNQFFLNQYHDKATVLHHISMTPYPNGETATHQALQFVAKRTLSPAHNGRNVSTIVIVLTDGRSTEETTTKNAAIALKSIPLVTVMAVGVGSHVDQVELTSIASDKGHVFNVATFDTLHTIQAELTNATCNICDSDKSDVCFVLDSSGSVGDANFLKELEFVNSLIESFHVHGDDQTKFCVITFSTHVLTEIQLNSFTTKEELMRNVLMIPYRNGETRTDQGMLRARGALTHTGVGARHAANKVAIVVTNGPSIDPHDTASQANKLHRKGIDTFAVGIGSAVDRHELESIASDHDHLITVQGFDQLSNAREKLVERICTCKYCGRLLNHSLPRNSLTRTVYIPNSCSALVL